MQTTQRRFIPFFLLCVYAASLVLVAPHHYDLDLISGSGNVQLATHADADNCKHIPISQLDSCPICLSVAGKATLAPTTFKEGVFDAVALAPTFDFISPYSFALINSFSRRGPPSPLA